jgi:hypothetical protein
MVDLIGLFIELLAELALLLLDIATARPRKSNGLGLV